MIGSEPLKQIYIDHAATTPVLPEVVRAMDHLHLVDYGNPSSRHHLGLVAEEHLRQARSTIAEKCAVQPEQTIFTSGGTEANALAILGAAMSQRKKGHLLVSSIEHPAVLRTAFSLQRQGFDVEKVPVHPGGWVEPQAVSDRLRPDTFLVCVMHVNNESGIRQPVEEICQAVKRQVPACQVLVDAVQSFSSLSTNLATLGADLMTISSHKIHGPKGVGCLLLAPGVRLTPLWGGGDQEHSRRPGTENVPGIVGFAKAVSLYQGAPLKLAKFGGLLLEAIQAVHPEAYPLGDQEQRVPHILAVAMPHLPTEVLINMLEAQGVCASSGSACHSRQNLRSHVLEALQIPREHGILRFSFSYTTSEEEVLRASEILASTLRQFKTKVAKP